MTEAALDDFDALFDRVITPALAPYEAERRGVLKRFWRLVGGGAVLSLVLAVVVASVFDGDLLFAVAVLGTATTAVYGYTPVHRFEARCKERALTDLAKALGMTYAAADFVPPAMPRLEALGLVPDTYDRCTYEDLFGGTRSGADFQLYEARLSRGDGKKRVTVFGGQILRIAFPKAFLGVTVVNRDSERRSVPEGLQRVGLESSQFERIFEVFGNDQVEARFLVHPAFMERLMALEAAMMGKSIRCSFDDRHLLVVVDGGNLFEVVNVFKPLPDREATRTGVEELKAVLGLIDAILAPPPNVWARPGKA